MTSSGTPATRSTTAPGRLRPAVTAASDNDRDHPNAADRRTAEMLREYRRTGDRRLRNRVVEEHASLAAKLAHSYNHTSEPFDDRSQVALVGLVKAAERFDPDHGAPFTAFAAVTIRGELQRHFRDHGWGVRVPRHLQELRYQVRGAIDGLTARLHRSPQLAEVAAHLGVPVADVIDALCADENYRPRTIEATGDERGPIAVVADAADPGFDAIDADDVFERLLTRCPPRLQLVLRLRFVDGLKQSEIAAQIGVSQVQVSRLLRQALALLREPARATAYDTVAS